MNEKHLGAKKRRSMEKYKVFLLFQEIDFKRRRSTPNELFPPNKNETSAVDIDRASEERFLLDNMSAVGPFVTPRLSISSQNSKISFRILSGKWFILLIFMFIFIVFLSGVVFGSMFCWKH